jgi:Ribosomal protein L7/L12 dimerisation domain
LLPGDASRSWSQLFEIAIFDAPRVDEESQRAPDRAYQLRTEKDHTVADLSKLMNELSNLTVLEAAELAKVLKEKWGVQRDPRIDQTDEDADIKLIQELIFQPREIVLQRFNKEETEKGKTPDFKLIKKSKLYGYCELKSPRDDWVFTFPDKSKPGESGVETRHSPTSNNLARQIMSAVDQLDAINPNHGLPNVLVLVNHAVGRTRSDLHVTLAGIPLPGGPNLFTLKLDHQKEVWAAARRVDLFLWVDPRERSWQPLYANDAVHRATVCSLLGIQEEVSQRVEANETLLR